MGRIGKDQFLNTCAPIVCVYPKKVDISEFVSFLKSKHREFQITKHASERSKQRFISLSVFNNDLAKLPLIVIEKEAEGKGERMFDLYYMQRGEYFHKYVIVLNDYLKLITLMRISKVKQSMMHGKRVV